MAQIFITISANKMKGNNGTHTPYQPPLTIHHPFFTKKSVERRCEKWLVPHLATHLNHPSPRLTTLSVDEPFNQPHHTCQPVISHCQYTLGDKKYLPCWSNSCPLHVFSKNKSSSWQKASLWPTTPAQRSIVEDDIFLYYDDGDTRNTKILILGTLPPNAQSRIVTSSNLSGNPST